jgi:DNA-binding MarR family transcriptional regulator
MDITENNFLYTITAIRQRLFRFLKRELAKTHLEDIAPSYGDILFVLERKGPITIQELAKHTLKDKSTISSVINKLEASGYIEKKKDAGDARSINLILTPKAISLRPILTDISEKMNAKAFEGLTTAEKAMLFELMQKVYRNL